MNVFVMTVKGRCDLTEQCLRSIGKTLGVLDLPVGLVIVDAAKGVDALVTDEVASWLDRTDVVLFYEQWIDCTLTQGWNRAIELTRKFVTRPETVNVLLLQNDSIFLREGWLQALEAKMKEPGVGSIGTSAMSVFGHPFVTGAVQGFNLAAALSIAEDGKVIDEHFNHAFPDVDISIRFVRAGYWNTLVDDMEHGKNPSVQHFVSQTMYSEHGVDKVMAMRAEEEKYFLQKWGNLEA